MTLAVSCMSWSSFMSLELLMGIPQWTKFIKYILVKKNKNFSCVLMNKFLVDRIIHKLSQTWIYFATFVKHNNWHRRPHWLFRC